MSNNTLNSSSHCERNSNESTSSHTEFTDGRLFSAEETWDLDQRTESFLVVECPSEDDVESKFMNAAEKCSEAMNLVIRKREILLMDLKKTLERKADTSFSVVKQKMALVHASTEESFQKMMKELNGTLSRVGKSHEEIQEYVDHCEDKDKYKDDISNYIAFLENSKKEKETLESEVKNIVITLECKREDDDNMLTDFKNWLDQQIEELIERLKEYLQQCSNRSIELMEKKKAELKNILQDIQLLKKVG
ncbi:uncharacterized protein LOC118194841 [Stegodyphus dumicola]|uniref:uncharacterized protein LOC118194841 n=1 Tax=Stegodyphus dumicola TaxID=202533 RepID=UPI0015A766B8|nr:uncharacterized protein LOC118194841 [Stegodyphus dumicola]